MIRTSAVSKYVPPVRNGIFGITLPEQLWKVRQHGIYLSLYVQYSIGCAQCLGVVLRKLDTPWGTVCEFTNA